MANLSDSKPTNVRVRYWNEVTVNTGNFENVKPGFSVEADVPEGVHPDEVKKKLEALVDGWLEKKLADFRAELND